MINFEAEAKVYKAKVASFATKHKLPYEWFERQDHVAFKAYNPGDYELLVEQVKPISQRISEIHMDGRRLATARLIGEHGLDMMMPFSLGPNIVYWIELMEARPEDQSDSPVKLDHEEIFCPQGIDEIRRALNRRGSEPLEQSNPSHSWLSVEISPDGDELKFTGQRLEDVVAEELAAGKATVIYSSEEKE